MLGTPESCWEVSSIKERPRRKQGDRLSFRDGKGCCTIETFYCLVSVDSEGNSPDLCCSGGSVFSSLAAFSIYCIYLVFCSFTEVPVITCFVPVFLVVCLSYW